MQFLFPSFLWALLALAIPVIIHLFYFRRFKTVYFTNVRFLKEVKEETSARRKLKNLLVLFSRLLAFAAIIFAFAQPFIPFTKDVKTGTRAVSVFVDNSYSMNALSQDVPLINQAKRKATEIVEGFRANDRFQILTNDFEGKHQRLVSQEDALAVIEEIQTSPSVRKISQVINRQKQALNSEGIDLQSSYLLTDFQKSITDLAEIKDTSLEINLAPLQSVQEKNISIDSCWFDAPVQMVSQTNKLIIRLRNHSNESAENVRLSIKESGQVKPVGTKTIPARSQATDTVNITVLKTGWHRVEVDISDFPITFDDKYFFTYKVEEEINVLSIHDSKPNAFLTAAFNGLPYFKNTDQYTRQLNYSSFDDYEMIILDDLKLVSSGLANELNQYVSNGGHLMIFPSATANVENYKNLLSGLSVNTFSVFEKSPRIVGDINTSEFVFEDVFENNNANLSLPSTSGSYKLTNFTGRREEAIMSYRDGGTFIGKYKFGKGYVFLSSAPLSIDYNDLARKGELFVPLLYKAAIIGNGEEKIAYTIGEDDQIETENRVSEGELVYKFSGQSGEFIPEQQTIGNKVVLGIGTELKQPGFYQLELEDEKPLAEYAFNFDRRESNLAYYSKDDLEAQKLPNMILLDNVAQANLTHLVGAQSQGITYWRICIILALIFLGIESLLIRFMKN